MHDPKDPKATRHDAYRMANRLLASAGVSLALAGIRPEAPEMEAIRRALKAVNLASGLEKSALAGKEAMRAFPPGGRRFPPRRAV